jgi:hypothetical protein
MRQYNSFFISVFLALGLLISAATKPGINHSSITTDPTALFTLADAEKIMGETGRLIDSQTVAAGVARDNNFSDSVSHIKKTASFQEYVYEAKNKDEKTGKTGKIYFVIEEYPNVSSAAVVYSYYKRANQHHDGFRELPLGDEAWYGNSPLFAYVRKANKIMILKVNGMTSKTSSDAFDKVVKNVAANF